ncbi:unnamed protein product [Durusdinium trenchii]|uniref:Uncharacterized protein n=2 Tax=Durusdinium trenchii TaxID=1381693 RepID=A0ABP0QXL1_9DINO
MLLGAASAFLALAVRWANAGGVALQPLLEEDQIHWDEETRSFTVTRMGATFGFVVHAGSGVPVRGGAPKVGQEHVAMQIYTDWSKKLFDPKQAHARQLARDRGCWQGMYTPDLCCSNGGWSACESEGYTLADCCGGWWQSKDAVFLTPVRECLQDFMYVLLQPEELQLRNPHHLHGSFYARLIHQLGFTKDLVLVEVGVDEGAFVQAVLLELKLLNSSVKKYYAIDPWIGRLEEFRQSVQVAIQWSPTVHIVQETGDIASRLLEDESVDFVFVDAYHSTPMVLLHLRRYWPKLRPGGVIAGHDFAPEKPWRFPGPVAAALQFAKEVKLEGRLLGLHGTTFALQKPDRAA